MVLLAEKDAEGWRHSDVLVKHPRRLPEFEYEKLLAGRVLWRPFVQASSTCVDCEPLGIESIGILQLAGFGPSQ